MLHHHSLLIVIGTAALLVGGCSGNQSREIAYRDVNIAELETQVGDLQGELGEARSRIQELESRPTQTEDRSQSARDALAGTGAGVEWRRGELVITLTNDILFGSGSATLTSNARTALSRVAGLIKAEYGSNYVRVEGHTDNDPIRRTKDKWEDNWHLAGARARSVLHFMSDQGGIPRERLSFAGYADTQPVAGNSSKSDKAKNRRVSIIVLPNR